MEKSNNEDCTPDAVDSIIDFENINNVENLPDTFYLKIQTYDDIGKTIRKKSEMTLTRHCGSMFLIETSSRNDK